MLKLDDGFLNKKLARYTSEPEIMDALFETQHPKILLKLTENVDINENMQRKLVALNNEKIDQSLLEQSHVLSDIKQDLFARYSENPEQKAKILAKLLEAGALSTTQQHEIFESLKGREISSHNSKELNNVFKKLITAKNFDPALQIQVAQSKNIVVRKGLANNENLTPEVQMMLAKDRAPSVRYQLAQNENLTEQVQNLMVHDKDSRIVNKIIMGKNLSPEVQEIVLKNPAPEIRAHLLNKENLEPKIQLALARDPEEKVRAAYAYNGILTPEIQNILARDKSKTVRTALLRKTRPLSPEIFAHFIKDPAEEVKIDLAKRSDFPSELYAALIASSGPDVKIIISEKKDVSDDIKNILAQDEDVPVRKHVVNYVETLPQDVLKRLAGDPDVGVRAALAGRDDIDKDIQILLAKDPSPEIRKKLRKRRDLDTNVRVMLQENIPEGFSQDNFVAKINKNKYVFRIIEKYMEDNKLNELTPKDFKGTPIERYYQQPLVNAMFRQNNGKPLTLEHIKKAIETIEAKEFYVLHGTMGSEIQSASQFKELPRHSFALLFKDLESDPETLAFMKDVAPKLGHGDHGSYGGWGNMNMGWVLWKDISSVMGYPSILIEQIQSDWRGLISKIRGMRDDINDRQNSEAASLLKQWEEKYGPDSLNRIQKNIDELVRDYPEKILSEFLSQSGVRGKTVFMTGKETQQKLIGHKSDKPDVLTDNIYDRIPRSLGFKDSDELKGFLKLERANMKYRQLIRQGAQKILKEAFDISGVDEKLKENLGILGGGNFKGFTAIQLHGADLNRIDGQVEKIIKQKGTQITVQSKNGTRTIDLAAATYLRVDSFRNEIRYSMDPHA